jgi:hypothetical protein
MGKILFTHDRTNETERKTRTRASSQTFEQASKSTSRGQSSRFSSGEEIIKMAARPSVQRILNVQKDSDQVDEDTPDKTRLVKGIQTTKSQCRFFHGGA